MAGLDELAASIAEQGVIQPIKVRHAPDGAGYIVTWGHRRLLASRQAGLIDIPAFIDDTEQTLEERSIEQLIENLHREDLNPIDRATAMRAVVAAGMTQAELARKLGLAPSTIANDLGLLDAPAKIQRELLEGSITPAHAKALKGLTSSTQAELVVKVIREGLSAHATEELVQRHKQSESWRKEREQAERASTDAKKATLAGSLERIEKRIPKGALVRILTWYNDADAKALARLLKDAGYTDVSTDTRAIAGPQKESLGCDCHAWQLEIASYAGTVTIRPACIVQAHRAAKAKADRAAYEAEGELHRRVHAKLAEVLVDEISKLGSLAARIALWELLGGWGAESWVRAQEARLVNVLDESKPKRRKRDAWATVAELDDASVRRELVAKLSFLHNQGDFKPDYEQLATELGIETPA
jgi:ParB family chromosome partitioning protein